VSDAHGTGWRLGAAGGPEERGFVERAAQLKRTTRRLAEQEGELQEAGAILDHLVKSGPVVMFRRRATDDLVTYVSPNIERLLGYSAEEVLEVPEFWREHVHPDDRARFAAEMEQAVKDRKLQMERDYRFEHKNGEYRWLHAVARFEYDGRGNPRSLLGYAVDITDRKEAEDEHAKLLKAEQQSSAQLRLLLQSTAEGIYGIDLEGRCTFINTAGARMLGHAAPDVIGKPMHDLIHHSHPDGSPYPVNQCPIHRSFRAGEGTRVEDEALWRRDGTAFPAQYSSHPIVEDGIIRGAVVTFLDITERKRVEEERRESEERLARIVETEASGIVIVNPEGRIIFANAAAEGNLRLTRSEIAERTHNDPKWKITTLQGEPFPDEQLPISVVRQTDQPVHDIELAIEPVGGERVLLSVNAAPLHDASGTLAGVVASFNDITDRKKAEERVLQAKEEAERANTAKSEFLSRMSHELRTPLNAVLGFAQLLEMDELTSEQRESTQQILKAGRHLLTLINEVLDISRIESGSLGLSIEPVGVRDLVQETLDLVQPIAASRDIALRVGDPDGLAQHVLADRQRLKQVIMNLLSNAVKYNHEGGAATVSCWPSSEGRLRIEVADTGPGISPERAHELFTPFQRLGAEQSEVEGTGLGLALSKRLVEAMGGTIGVESSPGQGTKFFVEFPLTKEIVNRAEVVAEVARKVAADPAPRTLVYIEDNLDNLRLVERIFATPAEPQDRPGAPGRAGAGPRARAPAGPRAARSQPPRRAGR
jgi:PAS domain S-box-containing protein